MTALITFKDYNCRKYGKGYVTNHDKDWCTINGTVVLPADHIPANAGTWAKSFIDFAYNGKTFTAWYYDNRAVRYVTMN